MIVDFKISRDLLPYSWFVIEFPKTNLFYEDMGTEVVAEVVAVPLFEEVDHDSVGIYCLPT